MSARLAREALRDLAAGPAVLPALVMVAVFLVLATADGGYFPTAFLPAGLLAVGLLTAAALALGVRTRSSRPVRIAALLLAGYATWSYLSILWAGDPGAAWDGANRSLLYAVVFAIFALWPMRPRAATAVVAAFGLGVAVLGLVTLILAATTEDASGLFVYGRFVEPLGYANGNVALWFSGVFPCLYVAARREMPAPIRGLGLGGATLLTLLALLGQSRGWLLVVPLALLAFLAVVPGRTRNAVALVLASAGVLAALGPVLEVFTGISTGEDPAPLLRAAARAILLSSAVVTAIGVVVAIADRRTQLAPSTSRRVARATAAACALLAMAVVVVALAAIGDPAARASAALQELTTVSEPADHPAGASRFASASGQNRADFWRVALGSFSDSPLVGAGADNFQAAYLQHGRTAERPQSPHSLELRVLSQTGLVGAVIFAGALIAALLAAGRAIRRRSGLAAATPAVATATFLYWGLHASIDWLYELPALAGPAFAMLGLAAGLDTHARSAGDRGSAAVTGGWLKRGAVIAAAAAAVVVLALPYLAQRNVQRSASIWSEQPDEALEGLGRAASLNPLSTEPHSTAAAIALRLDRLDLARAELERVLETRPESAFSTLILGAIASERGDQAEAETLLEDALRLSPNDVLTRDALEEVRAGGRLEAEATYDAALDRRRSLIGASPEE